MGKGVVFTFYGGGGSKRQLPRGVLFIYSLMVPKCEDAMIRKYLDNRPAIDGPITNDEVLDAIRYMTKGKVPGPDAITYEMLKALPPAVVLDITNL